MGKGLPKQEPGPAWVTCRPQVFSPNLNPQTAFLQIKVRVNTCDFPVFQHLKYVITRLETLLSEVKLFGGLSCGVRINAQRSNTRTQEPDIVYMDKLVTLIDFKMI